MADLTYESSGVHYDLLDAFKRDCQRAATGTVAALASHGVIEPAGVRGESAYLLETPSEYLAHVEEGLGTKNLVADEMARLTGRCFYRNVGIDLVATIVNDLATCGALPLAVAMHAAVGDSAWFADRQRASALAEGFAEGCRLAGAVWGGGETPALRGIVNPDGIVLAGSAVGRISPKSNRISGDIREGDAIILLSSSGVHTNGLTLCRTLAGRLPESYLTRISDGRTFGEALLDASIIYVRFIAGCQEAGLPLHYAVHITGHGWRKLMRHAQPFVYRISRLPAAPAVFKFMLDTGLIDVREAYATFNMGAGFAVYVGEGDVDRCLALARDLGYQAMCAGTVVRQGSRKAVEIEPLGISFEGAALQLRADEVPPGQGRA